MNEEAQAILDSILQKELLCLTQADIGFLKARREYIPVDVFPKYEEILTEKQTVLEVIGETPKTVEIVTPIVILNSELKEDDRSYAEILAQARDLGFSIPHRLPKNTLLAMIQSVSKT